MEERSDYFFDRQILSTEYLKSLSRGQKHGSYLIAVHGVHDKDGSILY